MEPLLPLLSSHCARVPVPLSIAGRLRAFASFPFRTRASISISLLALSAWSHSRYSLLLFPLSHPLVPSSEKPLLFSHTHIHLSCDPLAAQPLVSAMMAGVQSGHKLRDQHKRSRAAWLMLLESQQGGGARQAGFGRHAKISSTTENKRSASRKLGRRAAINAKVLDKL